jgi:hypothetical protein
MDPGEQITGTRDEHFDLISTLYHALQGAENCNTYALDAEAAGDQRLAAFFREAGVMQTQLAERAKGILGILEVPPEPEVRPEGAVPSDAAPGDVPPRTSAIQAGEVLPSGPEVPPTTDVPHATPGTALPGGDVESPLTGIPDEPTAVPPDEEVISEEAAYVASQADTGRITPEELDPTISLLEGATQLPASEAVAEIEAWERRLEASGDAELQSIAGNLGALRALLLESDIDADSAGPLLTTLGEQVQEVAASGAGTQIADKLLRLSELLTNEGRSLSG